MLRDHLDQLPPQRVAPSSGLLTVHEVAEECGVAVPTVRQWIRSGLLPAVTPGKGRIYRIRREDLAGFLERRPAHGEGVAPKVEEQVERILHRVRVRPMGDKS